MGGLVLNVATAQTITGLDLATLGLVAARLGAADYSDVQWFLETYAAAWAFGTNACRFWCQRCRRGSTTGKGPTGIPRIWVALASTPIA